MAREKRASTLFVFHMLTAPPLLSFPPFQFTAGVVARDAKYRLDFAQQRRMGEAAANVADARLADVLRSGVGFHHAGLDAHDRGRTGRGSETSLFELFYNLSTNS